jgi:hypothetical protein
MEEDHISPVPSKLNDLYVTDNPYSTNRYVTTEHIIPVDMIGNLLLFMGR